MDQHVFEATVRITTTCDGLWQMNKQIEAALLKAPGVRTVDVQELRHLVSETLTEQELREFKEVSK